MQNSLAMGLIFLIYWSMGLEFGKILSVFVVKSLEMGTFSKKFPKHGYLFLVKLPLNIGMGPELPAAHSRPIQILDPPPETIELL